MQTPLKLLFIVIVFIYILCILRAVKRKNMRIGYLIFWIIIGISFVIALLVPNLVGNISRFLGFEVPINMIFSIVIFVILFLIFHLMTLISKEEKKNVLLIQEISMLKRRVNELEKKEENFNDRQKN